MKATECICLICKGKEIPCEFCNNKRINYFVFGMMGLKELELAAEKYKFERRVVL